MDNPARLAAGVTYLACGHIFVAEDEELRFDCESSSIRR
jgi:hypothetical protein